MGLTFSVPATVQAALRFRSGLEAAERVQSTLMAQRWLDVEDRLTESIEALAAKIIERSAGDDPPSASQLFRLERFQVLQIQVAEEIQRYIGAVESDIDQQHAAIIRQGARNALTITQLAAVDQGATIQVSLMTLNARAVENLVGAARAGTPLGDLLASGYGSAVDGIVRELTTGSALGQNPRVVARRITNSGLANGYQRMEGIARDQMIRAYRLASQEQYNSSQVVRSFTRLAAKSDRTCTACLALDGKVYPTDRLMEVHPLDRCTMVPNIRGYPNVRFQTGKEWFKTLDEAQQRAILGPGKYELYRQGRIEFEDLATIKEDDIWGPSAQPTPLKDLAAA